MNKYRDKSVSELDHIAWMEIVTGSTDKIKQANLRVAMCDRLAELGKEIRNKPELIPCLKKLYKKQYSQLSRVLCIFDRHLGFTKA